MQNPSPCLGYRAGSDFASHCRACARHVPEPLPGRVGYVVATMRAEYRHGQTVYTCDAHIPLQHDQTVAPLTLKVCGADASAVTLRKRAARWLLAAGAVTIAVAAAVYSTGAHAAQGGPWNPASDPCQCGPWNPASDPYQGDHAAAVMRLTEIPEDVRRQLADMVRQQYGWQRVMLSRSGVVGADLADVRSMNFGSGCICAGQVDRSTWPAGRHESAKAYTVGRWSVLVFDSCRNVALATNTAALPAPAAPSREALEAARGPVITFAPDSQVRPLPEPGALALAAVALIGALAIRRRAH